MTIIEPLRVPAGLKGVEVTTTEVSDVRGAEGFYHYRQYSATELAEHRSFEDVWRLLSDRDLPAEAGEQRRFAEETRPLRTLPAAVQALLPGLAGAARTGGPLDGLRSAVSVLASAAGMRPMWDLSPDERRRDLLQLSAATPTLVAALHRLATGRQPLAPDDTLGHAANYLWMVTGARPDPSLVRALEQYLILTMDHGFNASTFTARVVASTGADAGAAVTAAIGALSGPLHGGAPSRALDTVDAIGDPARADAWVRDALARGERIMGFGHPVYRTDDPRSVMLRDVALRLGGDLAERAVAIERAILDVLAEARPERPLRTNVEYYAGVVMGSCGLPASMFTPTFAVSRVIGWCANIAEQAADRHIIRPAARYVGPPPPCPVPPAP